MNIIKNNKVIYRKTAYLFQYIMTEITPFYITIIMNHYKRHLYSRLSTNLLEVIHHSIKICKYTLYNVHIRYEIHFIINIIKIYFFRIIKSNKNPFKNTFFTLFRI